MSIQTYRLLLFVMAAALLAGCASSDTRARLDARANIEQSLDTASRPAPATPPAAVTNALLPELGAALPGDAEPRFDVVVNEAEARSFFMGLTRGTPYNMVLHPDVKGRITLNMQDVSIPETLDVVSRLYGYGIRRTGDTFMVLPASMQTRVFHVDYLNLIREGTSRTRVSSGQATQTPLQTQYAGIYGGAAGAGATGGDEQGRNKASTNIETQSSSDFWQELNDTLRMLVPDGEGRNVVINDATGVIMVRAMPDELRSVADYLASLQANAQRQVVLEAKFIEVELKDGFQTGINWWALTQNASRTLGGGMINSNSLFADGTNPSSAVTIQPGNPITGINTTSFGGVFALSFDNGDFNAFVELLQTQGDTHVLSAPRVTALNNQKAVIKVGSDEFFVTGLNSNTVAGTATNTNQNIQLTPFFSGIALDVTPQISAADDVLLHIHPSISEVTDQIKEIQFGGQTQRIPLAFSTVREADTLVRAQSGQIIVIGGLMKTSNQDQVAKVPLLGDIPVLGELFTQRKQVKLKSELVILLKPVVVNSDADWRELAREPQSRLFGQGDEAR